MKKIITTLILVLFLASCSTSSKTQENVSSVQKVEKTYFDINIPSKWTLIDNSSKTLPTPKSWEIVLAWSSNETTSWFSNNILILSQDLYKPITSKDFSVVNNVWSTKDYVNYEKLDEKTIDFQDKDSSTLYIFEAKYNTQTPNLKFLQIWKVCSYKKWYLLTIAISQDVKDTSKYEQVLNTFKCK